MNGMDILIFLFLLLLVVAVGIIIGAVFRLSRDVKNEAHALVSLSVLMNGMKIRQDLAELDNLRQNMREAIEHEDFEAAKKLGKLVDQQRGIVEDELNSFNKRYGDIAEISVTRVKKEK